MDMMKRGDVVILNLGGKLGKPRSAIIIQADILNNDNRLKTTIVLPLTSEVLNMQIIRYKIKASQNNGLQHESQIMIEKIMQIEKSKIQKVIGHLTKKQINEIEARLLAILGVN